MRALGHSSRRRDAGARWPWLVLWVGALLLFGVVLGGGALGEAAAAPVARLTVAGSVAVQDAARGTGTHGLRGVTESPPFQPASVRFHGAGFDTWASCEGGPSLIPAQPSWGPVRGRFPPSPFALPRWSRARREPSDTAISRRVRYPAASVSARGGLADQPPVVTRPLRGPPALG
ncbi:hypothetical protein JY651_46145 [Pyxidicoccus parkwayensis]|uniref:Uncharacterized protein n=1 Tax=Pyxidicoccus parkwayensis TaxID=2813578 RepID=A0ABX7NVC2_9BACT|nr:hypothetical protein [Pyxidicoccus parkwaysis]QSQ22423.1 hypothetical protein JY651_46145 [Pyxidicoccus parkwaysis]